jgi:AhpD family alkylhydroperoxidase
MTAMHDLKDGSATDRGQAADAPVQPAPYAEMTRTVSSRLRTLRTSTPEVMTAFGDLGRTATADGALDAKTKELIALALSVAARCDPCIGFHTQTLAKLGASRQEVHETLGVSTYMGGGPSLMYAAHAVAAFDEALRRSAPDLEQEHRPPAAGVKE